MQTTMKRIISLLLVFVLVLGMVACSETESTKRKSNKDSDESSDVDSPKDPEKNPDDNTDGVQIKEADELSDSDLRYVMIFNPKVYDENNRIDRSTLSVGSFGTQVDVSGNRGDGLEEDTEPPYTSVTPKDWMEYFPEGIQLEGDRADPMGKDYRVGTVKEFYVSSTLSIESRVKQQFVCNYAGEYCHIWSIDGQAAQSDIEELGEEFDEKIYEKVTKVFGTPRFVGETGKVNIVLHHMTGGLAGYFAPVDLFIESELGQMGLAGSPCNTGDAIININVSLVSDPRYQELIFSTTAHELQHLINFSAFFQTANGAMMHTWLNEGMSGYVETMFYKNAKEEGGHYEAFNKSALIRNGQSLYNFTTGYYDIGVYGSVYYFSQYLEELAGKKIFSSIMDYWRDSYSNSLDTAEALANSVSKSVYEKIDQSIDYSALNISFNSEAEEWMSKLTLNFYLSMLSNADDIDEFEHIDCESLLYDSLDGVEIEGGGRVIVALNDDTFEIPEDSDSGLIYIGLDENFRPITDFVHN